MSDSTSPLIKQKIDEYAGLIPKDLALKLLNESSSTSNPIAKNAKNLKFRAKIIGSKSFTFSSGKKQRILSVLISNIQYSLVLWNDSSLKYSFLINNDEIDVDGAYESGGDIHLLTAGKISIVNRKIIDDFSSLDCSGSSFNLLGTLASFTIDSTTFFVSQVVLSDSSNKTVTVSFTSLQLSKPPFSIGSIVLFENISFFNGSFSVTKNSRFFIQKSAFCKKLLQINFISPDAVNFTLAGNSSFSLSFDAALSLLGEFVALDILPQVYLELKKQTLLNSLIVLDSDGRPTKIRPA